MQKAMLAVLLFGAGMLGSLSCSEDPADPLTADISASLCINGGAAATKLLEASLSITATNATRMMISNHVDFSDGNWMAFVPTVDAWRLEAGEGRRTVYMQFGNETVTGVAATSASITLDQTGPDVSGIVATHGAGATSVTLSWSGAVDVLSGIAEYRVLLDENQPPETSEYFGTETSCLVLGLSCLTTYHWQVTVVDDAGNETTAGPWSFTTKVLFETVQIPPASVSMPLTFTMGGLVEATEVPHDVTLTGRFLMSETEVTEETWDAVMGTGTSNSQSAKWLSWDEAVSFCNVLSDSDGLTRAYMINGPDADVDRVVGANGWRLPTEAEWECACRANTDTPFNTGHCLDACTEANYCGRYPYTDCSAGPFVGHSVDVKSYFPNGWGLFDMHGNLWEWCYDGQRMDYENLPPTDPVFDGTPSENRILRGGAWYNYAQYCRSAARYVSPPTCGTVDSGWVDTFGFRPVRSAPGQQ